jgi:hypothetical protein
VSPLEISFKNMAQYRYIPLPEIQEVGRTPPFTRVMTLFPGTGSDPLSCTLEILEIESCREQFEALSYVWGREKAPDPILCGDGQLRITLNLDQALRHLRLPFRPRRLWVAAVCINQESLEERARQVSYMRLVYKHASSVIVWLGLKVPGVERAFAFAKYLAELRADLLCNAAGTLDPSALDAMMHPEVESMMIESMGAEPDSANDLTRLFEREYFERVWCIQEVAASRACVASCEEQEMNFFSLLSVAKYAEERSGYRFPPSTLQFWNTLFQSRQQSMMQSNRPTVERSIGNY